jgi:transposase-like protein
MASEEEAMNLTDPIYHDADKARQHIEAIFWPRGPVCPHCGAGSNRIGKLQGKSTRPGVYKCRDCERPFTVTVGTVMEDSKIPLNKWLMAFALVNGSKKGISAHQLHRSLGITYKSAWFMAHRIREAMSGDDSPMGGPGADVEADETYWGKNPSVSDSRMAIRNMNRIVSLIDRNTGRACSVVFNGTFNADTIGSYLFTRVDRGSRLITDDAHVYKRPGLDFASHKFVNHTQDEYVSRLDPTVTTNTVEGFFAIFKRGMRGIYQHCGQNHLHRYLAEFDFRYSHRAALGYNDAERTAEALKGARGKRLMYRQPGSLAA